MRERLAGIPGLLRKRETSISSCWHWKKEVTNNRVIAMQPQTVCSHQFGKPPNQMQLDATRSRLFVAEQFGPDFFCLDCYNVSTDKSKLILTPLRPPDPSETAWLHSMYVALRPNPCAPSSPVGVVICPLGLPVLFDRDRKETILTFMEDHQPRDCFTRCSWQRNIMRPTEIAMARKAKKPIVICNIETQQKKVLPAVISSRSEVLCLEFMARSPLLLTGCRNSSVFAVDLRMRHRTGPVLSFSMTSSVGELKALLDENYVLAMALNGQFGMYDLRFAGCIQQYQQHVGSHRRLSFCTNSEVSLIFAPGEDRIVRVWDIHQSQPIKQFVPELVQGDDEPTEGRFHLPCVTYGDYLGGSIISGLLTSCDTSVHCYTI